MIGIKRSQISIPSECRFLAGRIYFAGVGTLDTTESTDEGKLTVDSMGADCIVETLSRVNVGAATSLFCDCNKRISRRRRRLRRVRSLERFASRKDQ